MLGPAFKPSILSSQWEMETKVNIPLREIPWFCSGMLTTFLTRTPLLDKGTSLVAQTVKHLSTMWETRVQSLGWEDPMEKEMATHSSTIAWKIPWTEEPGRLQSMGSQSRTWLSNFTITITVSDLLRGFPGGSVVICLPIQEMQETQFWSLGWEDPMV